MAVVVHWNGKDLPKDLHALPQGRYVIESVDAVPALSQDEEAGLDRAIASLRQGLGVPAEAVFNRLEERPPLRVIFAPEAEQDLNWVRYQTTHRTIAIVAGVA